MCQSAYETGKGARHQALCFYSKANAGLQHSLGQGANFLTRGFTLVFGYAYNQTNIWGLKTAFQ